jgi:hypothetical protein
MASQPTKAVGDYTSRGEIYSLVTHRPAEDRRDEASFIAGYEYKKKSEVTVSIGGQNWQFFTHKDGAWAPTEADDKSLVQAMIKGSTMMVKLHQGLPDHQQGLQALSARRLSAPAGPPI